MSSESLSWMTRHMGRSTNRPLVSGVKSIDKTAWRDSLCESYPRFTITLILLMLFVGCGASESTQPSQTQSTEPVTADDIEGRLRPGNNVASSDSAQALAAATAMLKEGELEAASKLMSQQLIRFPDDGSTLLLASRVERASGNRQTAIELAETIPIDSAKSVDATSLLIQLYLESNRPQDAISRIENALNQNSIASSHAVIWRQQLWAVFNRLGRRQEASAQADMLCRAGYINRQLLISLLRRTESFPFVLEGQPLSKHFYPGLGVARWYFSHGQFEQAIKHLSQRGTVSFESPSARALHGRLLAETQAKNEFRQWYVQCDEETRKFSDYWAALGIFFFDQQRLPASAFALWQAVSIDPTDDDACHRLARVLAALDRKDDSLHMREHGIQVAKLRNLLKRLSLDKPQPEMTDDLPEKLLALGRPFESIGWSLLDLPRGNDAKRDLLAQQRDYLRGKVETVNMASEVALTQISHDDFSMDDAVELLAASASESELNVSSVSDTRPPPMLFEPRLDDVAHQTGLDFQWYHAKEIDLSSIPLHELVGGGICVCDYDRNGYPDIYFGQGSGDPPSERCTRSNKFFRNVNGQFLDVTVSAAAEDFHYSSGIAAGDVNQDGFPDLYLGALGDNRLLINNGDGTFSDSSHTLDEPSPQFTTSVAVADLTGNGIPDLFECVYVEMEDAFRLPERGADGMEMTPSPSDFYAEVDRWYANQGDGNFRTRTIDRERIEPGTSLGLVITDIDADGSNDVFVGNDARPNHVLKHFGAPPIQDVAGPLGLAFGFRGFSNSCMGIAPGDFDRDGRLDFHITNFLDEPNNYFLQGETGVFGDYAARYGLDDLTEAYIGFGIKAIDFNRDGWIEFFTTNGHVFDERIRGVEFQMPPQIALNQGREFVSHSSSQLQGYCSKKFVGRSVAKIDFDRDLDMDLVVGHLDSPSALLTNRTMALGNAMQFVFVGTICERDAIGTRVVVTADDQQFTNWVSAGNGFLCSDDSVVDFGIGSATKAERVEVFWGSGGSQVFRDVEANQRYVIVQGQDIIWPDAHN